MYLIFTSLEAHPKPQVKDTMDGDGGKVMIHGMLVKEALNNNSYTILKIYSLPGMVLVGLLR